LRERGQDRGLGVTNPKVFFNDFVRRAYEEFLKEPASEYRAKHAVGEANIMAERAWHWLHQRDPSKVFHSPNAGRYRQELVASVCPDFQLVWDVADGHKHWTLTRPSRRITQASQTRAREGAFDPLGFDPGFDTPRIVITLDDGTERLLADALAKVMAMWEDIATSQL